MKEKTYLYFQPAYVSKFKCDGQLCNALCCRQSWKIDFDKKTFKKYERIKPKTEADKITKHFQKVDKGYRLIPRPCPFLREDNLCDIQKKYGEEYLSEVCASYPRHSINLGDFFERALSLTCPVVAMQVLIPDEPMIFEKLEVSEKIHSNAGKFKSFVPVMPMNLYRYVYSIQFAAISILQERSLSIDGRLIILGFFLDKLDELISNNNLREIENLAAFYSSEQFLTEDVSELIKTINFDVREHIKIMLNIFETLYGDNSVLAKNDKRFIEAITYTLNLKVDENKQISLNDIVKHYESLNESRKKFVEVYSTIFENYLVNEFFGNLYPWRLPSSIASNYGVFVTTYKMLELIAVSVAVFNFEKNLNMNSLPNKVDIISIIMQFVGHADHGAYYTKKIFEQFKNQDDIASIMKNFLQG